MADIVITPSLVRASNLTTSFIKRGVAGETIAAGDVVRKDTSDNTLKLADADDSTKADVEGVALGGAAAGQPFVYAIEDADFDLGATVAAGTTIILSDTPGKMCPDADASAGSRKIILGAAKGGRKMTLKITKGGTL